MENSKIGNALQRWHLHRKKEVCRKTNFVRILDFLTHDSNYEYKKAYSWQIFSFCHSCPDFLADISWEIQNVFLQQKTQSCMHEECMYHSHPDEKQIPHFGTLVRLEDDKPPHPSSLLLIHTNRLLNCQKYIFDAFISNLFVLLRLYKVTLKFRGKK